MDLVRHYSKHMGEAIIPFLETLIGRIQAEIANADAQNAKNPTILISKCWNIIRVATENDQILLQYSGEIEERLKPLFEYVLTPEKIDFEDDMVMVIKTFIKKNRFVSETLWTLFPHLYLIFKKNKNTFGNLLDTLN